MIVSLRDVLDNVYCLEEMEGLRVYKILFEELKQNNKVVLSFVGTRVCSSIFLESAIGRLLSDFKKEFLYTNLKFNFAKDQERLKHSIGLIILNAERYYTDEKHRNKLNAAYKKYDKQKKKKKNVSKKILQ